MISPNEVKTEALRLEEENNEFRAFLKNHPDNDKLDARFLALHKEMFADYDCCTCSNCCKKFTISLDNNELRRIAYNLGMNEYDFGMTYLTDADPFAGRPYHFKEVPCVFLDANGRCEIQDCKPDVCVGFPYTDHPERLYDMHATIERAEACPIIFEILERLKVMYEFASNKP